MRYNFDSKQHFSVKDFNDKHDNSSDENDYRYENQPATLDNTQSTNFDNPDPIMAQPAAQPSQISEATVPAKALDELRLLLTTEK